MNPVLLMRLATATAVATVAASVAFGLAWMIAQRYRRTDAGFWHAVWSAMAVASLLAPCAALLPPVWRVSLPLAPAAAGSPIAILLPFPAGAIVQMAAGIYLAGAGFLLASFLVGLMASVRLRRESRALDARGARRVGGLAPDLVVAVRVHARLRVPVTVGWRRAVILLPESWGQWRDDRLLAVLRHEAAHIARRDFVWHAVAALQQAVFWINPLAWRLARRIRLTAELDADRIAAGVEREDYAAHLVEAAHEVQGFEAEHSVFAPGATHNLSTRIDALLEPGLSPATPAAGLLRVVGIALVAIVIIAPMLVQAIEIQHRLLSDADVAPIHAARHPTHGH